MTSRIQRLLAASLAASTVALAPLAQTSEREQTIERIVALLPVIAAEHIDPPSRRELLRAGVEALTKNVSSELGTFADRLPASNAPAATARFLEQLFESADAHAAASKYGADMVRGILHRLPGYTYFDSPRNAAIDASNVGNRYVGVGVSLGISDGVYEVGETHFGGPAHRAGIRAGDMIYAVQGVETSGMSIERFLDLSRGPEGTELVFEMGHPSSPERYDVRLTRSVVTKETVTGASRADDESWNFGLDGTSVAFVRVGRIRSSTPDELRRAIARIRRDPRLDGRIILDLRNCSGREMHNAALTADLFQSEGLLGASETRRRRFEYPASEDRLCDPMSVVVLIASRTTYGTGEWLAAVLRRGGATLIGSPTPGRWGLSGRMSVAGFADDIVFACGRILDPEPVDDTADDTSDAAQSLTGVRPHHLLDDSGRALDEARAFFGFEPSSR